jgi:RNA polymerase sigma factor (TIGR02999 family)
MDNVNELLRRAREHDRAAIDELVAILYPDLRRMAQARLAQNGAITLLDTSAMLNESYLRLANAEHINAVCRGQFLAYASQVMRSVIVDFARKRGAERRGGAAERVTLTTDLLDGQAGSDDDIERVHEALNELEKTDPRLKAVVEMRYFGGFDEKEIAEALGVAVRTVRRDWERARLLLLVALKK